MKIRPLHPFVPLAWAYCLLAAFSATGFADDTDIYSGSGNVSGTVAPNVLLLLDTSGSMSDEDVITTHEELVKPSVSYDPQTNYVIPNGEDRYGNDTSCSFSDRVFHSSTASNKPFSNGCLATNYFTIQAFHCQAAATVLNSQGYWAGGLAGFNPAPAMRRWGAILTGHRDNALAFKECGADIGTHGRAVSAASFTGTNSLQLVVPDMAAGDAQTYIDKDFAPLPYEWVEDTHPGAIDETFVFPSIVVYHPNYMRYLYGYVDVNGNAEYDEGEGYNEDYFVTVETNHGRRLDVLKSVMNELLDTWTGVNVGIMRYNVQSGARVIYPVSRIEDHRQNLKDVVTALVASDATPHSEALYEAFNYYRGHYVEFGEAHSNKSVDSSRNPLDRNLYRTPINFSCQANTIIHMTDGKPTRDGGTEDSGNPVIHYFTGDGVPQTTSDVDTAIHALPGFNTLSDSTCSFNSQSSEQDGVSPDNCMDELAEYMASRRHDVSILNADGSLLAEVSAEPIRTYTIGFTLDLPFLRSTAMKGGGEPFSANDVEGLKDAFEDMIESIKNAGTRVISPPGVAVEAFSRSMHLNQLYFNLFQPELEPLYKGNLKRYQLALVDGEVTIVDKDLQPAIDLANGGFNDSAKSWWSDEADGNVVTLGGMAGKMPLPRNLYTHLGSTADLTEPSNRFTHDNPAIDANALALPTEESGERDRIIDWALGYDAFDENANNNFTEARRRLGDPLHSRPTLVVYDSDLDNDQNHNDPDMQVVTLTNDGFMRVVDAETGVEAWSFIPVETWPVLNKARKNNQETKLYGLDGQITVSTWDVDEDGIIEAEDGDWNRVFFGMRRGGRSYYAIDMTRKNQPAFLWQLNGGSEDFPTLGQSWGQMQRAQIDVNGTRTRVLVFTGGYDTAYDDAVTTMPTATMGNDVYIVRESNGELIWRANRTESAEEVDIGKMTRAFPAEPVVLDMNRDGLHDRIYAVDIAGQVWRFDIQNGAAADDLVTGAVIANLSTPGGPDNRKFFNQPDVAILQAGSHQNVSINVGSGFRAGPLDMTTHDYFFSVRDPFTYGDYGTATQLTQKSQYAQIALITAADLFDATTIPDLEPTISKGWKLALEASGGFTGEKALASSVTVNGEVLFTTFEPPHTPSADGCVINVGTSRMYSVALHDGLPIPLDDDGDDAPDEDPRWQEIPYAGIAPSVVVLFPEATDAHPVGCVGPHCVKLNFDNKLRRTYWYTPERDPAN